MLPTASERVVLFSAIALVVLCIYGLVRLRLQPTLKKASMYHARSAPAVVLGIGLALLGVSVWVLGSLGLLRPMVEGAAFQSVSFVLATVAIVFALIQFWESGRHGSKIEQLVKSMSTRYIGMFPKNLDDIVDVVRHAHKDLLIMADFVDYGSYSRPETYETVVQELERACEKGVSVRFLVYGDKPAGETLQNQFKESEFARIQSRPQFLHYFGKKYPGIERPTTCADFLRILQQKQEDSTHCLLDKGVKIRTLSERVWLFFWLQDDQEAVFVFEDIVAPERGLAFRTRDAKLVETFKGIFDRSYLDAPELPGRAAGAKA